MGDTQKLTPDEQIRSAFEAYENGKDFTVAVEEEFAILDPETLELANRFEEFQAAAQGGPLERASRRRADRVRGRGPHRALRDVRRGRREHGRAALAAPRARAVRSSPRSPRPARIRGAAGRTSGSSTRLTTGETTRSSGTSSGGTTLRPPRARGHQRSRPRRRRVQRAAQLPARAARALASSPFVEGVYSGLHSARTELFTRMFPRCGVPDVYDGWDGYERYVRFLYETGSIDGTRSSGGASARISRSRQSRSASATRSQISPRRSRSPR